MIIFLATASLFISTSFAEGARCQSNLNCASPMGREKCVRQCNGSSCSKKCIWVKSCTYDGHCTGNYGFSSCNRSTRQCYQGRSVAAVEEPKRSENVMEADRSMEARAYTSFENQISDFTRKVVGDPTPSRTIGNHCNGDYDCSARFHEKCIKLYSGSTSSQLCRKVKACTHRNQCTQGDGRTTCSGGKCVQGRSVVVEPKRGTNGQSCNTQYDCSWALGEDCIRKCNGNTCRKTCDFHQACRGSYDCTGSDGRTTCYNNRCIQGRSVLDDTNIIGKMMIPVAGVAVAFAGLAVVLAMCRSKQSSAGGLQAEPLLAA